MTAEQLTGDRPADRTSDRRGQILRAAARRIARDGVRGMRVNDVAAEAGVSPGLLYYHFTDRAGLLEATLEHINLTAREARTAGSDQGRSALQELEHELLGELDDDAKVRENSAAWNELRALAVFESNLREPLARSTAIWVGEIAEAVADAQREIPPAGPADPERMAAILVAVVEGLSNRWLAGGISTEDARSLLSEATNRLLNHARFTPAMRKG